MSQQLAVCFPHKGLNFPSARANERFTHIMQQHINHVEVGLRNDMSPGASSPATVGSDVGASPPVLGIPVGQIVAPPSMPAM
eukprot:6463148-Amphidinium_carterae.1